MKWLTRLASGAVLLALVPVAGAAEDLPPYLRDRGAGMRTSMFGSYVEKGELLIYPFYEYYRDDNQQYSPDEYGGTGIQDLEARYRANEGILFASYGITDRLNIEAEAAVISAEFEKDPTDTYGTPARIKQSGLGDVEGQVTYTWLREGPHRPEIYTFAEAVIPHAKDKALIGTEDWEFAFAVGGAQGFGFGTILAGVGLEYTRASDTPWDLGEWQVGYLRRVSPAWRVYAGVEGQATDEASLITEAQRRLSRVATLKLNLGVGLTSNSTDLAPEVGIMFGIPTGRK